MGGRVLTVASGKGGVGKTTTAVNLAVALWTEGNAVAVVDADLGMANLAAVLGLEPETTLHDVLAGRATVGEALVEAQDGDLLVLPGERSLTGFAEADPNALEAVLEELAERCDYVVVDTGAGLSYEDVLPLGLADGVLLVTTPDPAAIGDTRKTLELSGLLSADVLGVVVTRALEDTDADAVAREIGVDLLASIPDDPAVTKSTTGGQPLASHAPDAPATQAYGRLATAIIGDVEDAPEAADEATEATDDAAQDADEASTADEPTDGAASDETPSGASPTDADAAPPSEPPESEESDDEAPADGQDESADDEDETDPDEDETAADEGETDESEAEERERRRGWLRRLFS